MKLTFALKRSLFLFATLSAACATDIAIDDDGTLTENDDNAPEDDTPGAGGETSMDDDDDVKPPDIVVDDSADDMPPKPAACGDGAFQAGEVCDDGNRVEMDGCSADCTTIALGFSCPEAGSPCVNVEVCGDGRQTAAETCDDGNVVSADGCTATCALEANFACTTPGMACLSTVECGDGRVAGAETCDDGALVPGDGCDETCLVEPGYSCPTAGRPCIAAACGDGLLAGLEDCEDGNAVASDGCGVTCRAEIGFVCEVVGMACRAAVCGDDVVEGGEPCDDGKDTNTGDGCTPGCVLEPNCDNGACTSGCGDGLTLSTDQEGCDDGNLQPGDGCGADCKVEAGFKCDQVADVAAGSLVLPVVYRDFRGRDETNTPGVAEAHPDFQMMGTVGLATGLVNPTLGAAGSAAPGKPVFSGVATQWVTSADSFSKWYRSVPGVNQTVVSTLMMGGVLGQPGSYQFDDSTFFPMDGGGWMSVNNPAGMPYEAARTGGHNFFFTSELTYWFEYKQAGAAWPRLDFRGDDDVWVFINRKLAVDLGGIHGALDGSVQLEPVRAGQLGLEVGKVYEIKVFQAERRITASSYKLTLSGFTKLKTRCDSVCGDGTVTADEVCDDGAANGPGYGKCTATCELGPRCGDGVVSPEEMCDNGLNLDAYKTSPTACAPGCMAPGSCGDGTVDASFGEACDDGVNDGAYNGCSKTCQLGPRCGDGIKQSPQETCDDGNQINGDKCDFECKIEPPRMLK